MADSIAFVWAGEELERTSSLDRLEARGTLRLALKKAGLEAGAVTVKQMEVVLRELLPEELERRGVEDGRTVCAHLVQGLLSAEFADAETSMDSPEAVFRRLGGR